MGAKHSKKKKKKKNAKPLAQKANRDTYFATDRIKHLPRGHYYTAITKIEEAAVCVFVTREHVNDCLSFAYFGISMFTGEIKDCDYQFNIKKEFFEELIEEFQLKPFAEKQSIELLIYDALNVHQSEGYPSVQGTLLAKNILSWDYDFLKNSPKAIQLFPFQNPDFDLEQLAQQSKPKKQLKNKWHSYHPQLVKGWTKQHWEKFLEKTLDLDPQEDLDEFEIWTPLVFILEKHYLPQLFANKQIMTDLDRLEKSLPDLTGNELTDINFDYEMEQEEVLLQQSIQIELDSADSRKKWVTIQKRCEEFIEKFPRNEIVPFYLLDAYNYLGYTNKAYQLSSECYHKMPSNSKAIVQYLSLLMAQNKNNLIKQLLSNGFLLEDHVPSQYKFKLGQYHYYYFELDRFLFQLGHWQEAWRLMNWFINSPGLDNNETIKTMWSASYFTPAYVIYKEICETHIQNKAILNKIADNMAAASLALV